MPFHPSLPERLAHHFPLRRSEVDDRCLATYDLLLRYFKNHVAIPEVCASDAKTAVVLVYTCVQSASFKPDSWSNFPKAKEALLRDRSGRLTLHDIEALRQFVGSLAATANFLHFCNPRRYAIWNATVARAAYRYSWHQCARADYYLQYLDDLNELTLDDPLRQRIQELIGAASELRSKEFALSQLGIAESTLTRLDDRLDMSNFPFAPELFTWDLTDTEGDDQD